MLLDSLRLYTQQNLIYCLAGLAADKVFAIFNYSRRFCGRFGVNFKIKMTTAATYDNKDLKVYANSKGEYVRKDSTFRNWVSADGSTGFKAEPNRYHLYVSYACPWAHRTLIMRRLKALEDIITFDVVDYLNLDKKGWRFNPEVEGSTPDTINGFSHLIDVYLKSDPNHDPNRKPSVPVLYDKQKGVIVNNESSEIIRMLNSEFNEFCARPEAKALDFYPTELREKIDELNSWIYP